MFPATPQASQRLLGSGKEVMFATTPRADSEEIRSLLNWKIVAAMLLGRQEIPVGSQFA